MVLDGDDLEILEYLANKETTEVTKVPVGGSDDKLVDIEPTQDVLSEHDDRSFRAYVLNHMIILANPRWQCSD